jgi:glycosyltransferase involved in cell wall biosynthesis
MKISYGITVCDEHEELNHLLYSMRPLLEDSDEIIILRDISKTNPEVTEVIDSHKEAYKNQLILIETRLNNDFATFKNQLLTWATGDYLFQIDADEIPNEFLIKNLKLILESNDEIDCYYIPRVNIVLGLTQSHIQKWGWNVDDKNRVNFPDPQMRLFKLNKDIKWKNKVHEVLDNYKTISALPYDTEDFCLYHIKSIEKQEKQNNFYNTL